MNLILMTDSYKVSHWKQYPPKTTGVYSYFESRGGEYDKVLFFGLQYIIKKYLLTQITQEDIEEAELLFTKHFGTSAFFNKEGWQHVCNDHSGYLPIEIKAVAEGSLVPTHNILFSVENTCPDCYWLTSYVETLLEQVWYPSTIATKSYMMKQTIKTWLDLTGHDAPDFKLHDFGYRGSTSQESAGIGGAAHLVNFKGTDTLAAIRLLQEYYSADMPAFSIPAAEHSTVTSWGKAEWGEMRAFRNMLNQFSTGLVAVVSDSYDVYYACSTLWGGLLKDEVLKRDGTLIIRPDSGDPVETVLKVMNILGERFNWKQNDKGYYVLPKQVRVIQGDGIDENSLVDILDTLEENEISADNIAFGSGGGLLQNVTRDTLKFAYKASAVTIDGVVVPISKNPKTDATKKSKAGKLALIMTEEGYKTIPFVGNDIKGDELKTVFKDGELLIDQTLEEIRGRAI